MLSEKFVMLCAFSGATALMRAGIGAILADPEARTFIEQQGWGNCARIPDPCNIPTVRDNSGPGSRRSAISRPLRSVAQALFVTDGAVQGLDLSLEVEGLPRFLERRMPVGWQEVGGLFEVRSALLDKGPADLPEIIEGGVTHDAPFGKVALGAEP